MLTLENIRKTELHVLNDKTTDRVEQNSAITCGLILRAKASLAIKASKVSFALLMYSGKTLFAEASVRDVITSVEFVINIKKISAYLYLLKLESTKNTFRKELKS